MHRLPALSEERRDQSFIRSPGSELITRTLVQHDSVTVFEQQRLECYVLVGFRADGQYVSFDGTKYALNQTIYALNGVEFKAYRTADQAAHACVPQMQACKHLHRVVLKCEASRCASFIAQNFCKSSIIKAAQITPVAVLNRASLHHSLRTLHPVKAKSISNGLSADYHSALSYAFMRPSSLQHKLCVGNCNVMKAVNRSTWLLSWDAPVVSDYYEIHIKQESLGQPSGVYVHNNYHRSKFPSAEIPLRPCTCGQASISIFFVHRFQQFMYTSKVIMVPEVMKHVAVNVGEKTCIWFCEKITDHTASTHEPNIHEVSILGQVPSSYSEPEFPITVSCVPANFQGGFSGYQLLSPIIEIGPVKMLVFDEGNPLTISIPLNKQFDSLSLRDKQTSLIVMHQRSAHNNKICEVPRSMYRIYIDFVELDLLELCGRGVL